MEVYLGKIVEDWNWYFCMRCQAWWPSQLHRINCWMICPDCKEEQTKERQTK